MSPQESTATGVRILPLVLLITLSLGWGLGPSIVKFVALHDVPPIGFVFWQTFIAGTLLLGISVLRGVPIRVDRRHLRYFLAMGLLGLALPNINMAVVMRDMPVGLMGVIIITAPVITYLIALAIRLEAFAAMRASGVALGFVGAAILVLPRGSLPSPDLLPVALLAFLTPALWAAGNIVAEVARPKDGDTMVLAGGTMYAAAGGSLIAALTTGTFHPIWIDFGDADWVIVGYGALTFVNFFLFFTIVKLAGAVYLAQVGYIVTLMGVGWGALFYGEEPSVWLWVAIVPMFVGVALVNFGRKKPAPAATAEAEAD